MQSRPIPAREQRIAPHPVGVSRRGCQILPRILRIGDAYTPSRCRFLSTIRSFLVAQVEDEAGVLPFESYRVLVLQVSPEPCVAPQPPIGGGRYQQKLAPPRPQGFQVGYSLLFVGDPPALGDVHLPLRAIAGPPRDVCPAWPIPE